MTLHKAISRAIEGIALIAVGAAVLMAAYLIGIGGAVAWIFAAADAVIAASEATK